MRRRRRRRGGSVVTARPTDHLASTTLLPSLCTTPLYYCTFALLDYYSIALLHFCTIALLLDHLPIWPQPSILPCAQLLCILALKGTMQHTQCSRDISIGFNLFSKCTNILQGTSWNFCTKKTRCCVVVNNTALER